MQAALDHLQATGYPLQDSDLEPVTLRFVDLNGDRKLDMVIEVQGSQIVFLNDQGSFRPLKPGEQNQIMQRLRQLGQ